MGSQPDLSAFEMLSTTTDMLSGNINGAPLYITRGIFSIFSLKLRDTLFSQ